MAKIAVVISDLVNDFFHPKGLLTFPACYHIVPPIKMLCDEANNAKDYRYSLFDATKKFYTIWQRYLFSGNVD